VAAAAIINVFMGLSLLDGIGFRALAARTILGPIFIATVVPRTGALG